VHSRPITTARRASARLRATSNSTGLYNSSFSQLPSPDISQPHQIIKMIPKYEKKNLPIFLRADPVLHGRMIVTVFL
jgi:hypothetical protein